MTGQLSLPRFAVLAVLGLIVTACTATGPQVIKVLHDQAYSDVAFENILVIGVASDYTARAQFERTVASGLIAAGTSATAYHTVVGHNPPLTRSDVMNAIRARGFDAVLITRVKGQEVQVKEITGAPVTKQTRRDLGEPFNVFRYDYEELNNPVKIDISESVNLVTELYSAADEKKVWAIETVNTAQHVGLLIDQESKALVRELRRDGKIG